MKTVQCVDCVRAKLQIAWWRISIMIFFLWYFLPPPPTHSRRIEHEKYKNYVHSFFSFSFSFVNCQEEEEEEKKLSKLRCVCVVGLDCDETWPVSWHWWRTLVVLIIYTLIQSAAAFKNSLFIFSFLFLKQKTKQIIGSFFKYYLWSYFIIIAEADQQLNPHQFYSSESRWGGILPSFFPQ